MSAVRTVWAVFTPLPCGDSGSVFIELDCVLHSGLLNAPPMSWHHLLGAWPPSESSSDLLAVYSASRRLQTPFLSLFLSHPSPSWCTHTYALTHTHHMHTHHMHTHARTETHAGLLRHGCTNTICLLLKVCKQKETICVRCSFCVQFQSKSLRRCRPCLLKCAFPCVCVFIPLYALCVFFMVAHLCDPHTLQLFFFSAPPPFFFVSFYSWLWAAFFNFRWPSSFSLVLTHTRTYTPWHLVAMLSALQPWAPLCFWSEEIFF